MQQQQKFAGTAPAPDLAGGSPEDVIDRIETTIVDVPLRRTHFHSSGTHGSQSYVVVQLFTKGGAVGLGEGVTPGGRAFWGGESVESIKATIDHYLAPALKGCSVFAHERLLKLMDRAAARSNFAKAAVDIALHDVVSRLLDTPLAAFYGGKVRDSIPVLWPLATGDYDRDVDDALEQLSTRRHRYFKMKIGQGDPEADVKAVSRAIRAIHAQFPEACITLDFNQAWDEQTAARWLPALQEAGAALIEQPVPAWNAAGMARLASRLDIPVMADEGLWDLHDAYDYFTRGATDVFCVKVAKGGGIRRAYKAAAVAEAAGIPLCGGMALESSIGTAASLQLFGALPNLTWGSETIGPRLIADDLATEPIRYREYEVLIPDGPGIGAELDTDKFKHYRRA
ncbi:muconate cycloisomerase family protein [Rhizobiales bacterium]|uniref:muconate cycloisomerase family protein n=1 Tax=Hongsoonwoonella zoysiae TaxID=2821844 RepID=UPI001560C3F5|nr:muconate cycloisomerase family protein [Hongsoonwoonella zoysiae]NRG16216.1 muconate cycloisomerase family protein [Hongsoonwoonella zoysiae]